MANIKMTDQKPEPPQDADFAIIIDFKKGEGSPTRVFSAATDLIEAFQAIDKVLVRSVDNNISPVMMLEDVEVGSLKIWLRNALTSTDDQALKDLDWKPAVGKYLVRAKYMVMSWIDDDTTPRSLPDLRKDLQKLASETDVRRLPDYSPPDPSALVDAAQRIQTAKDILSPSDRAFLEAGDQRLEIDINVRLDPDQLADMATKETITMPPAQMILAVKKPDYLGASKWDFRLGKRPISARIEHNDFLAEFQGRRQDVRPGDALRCMVSVEMRYGFDNEMISEIYVITEVIEVLEDSYDQGDLFDGDS
ncbi:hypothetical protein [uncultured Tateyamaria sp.]|uniref:hypothetical protein n=1 Tax=uncultured Tateyamaria sp. TaxID=455651 RepID=UPI00262F5CEE|nr:hypothetical protein [uncultured Tateyamaria sp.]